MEQLIRQIQLGDITFGVPGDVAVLNQPWGFYKFLGVSKDAPPEDIRRAYRALSKKFHPDAGGKPGDFENLERIAKTLLDDGGVLGLEHGQKRHYDRVSSLDEYFDGFIKNGDERTRKLSEAILAQIQIERYIAKFQHELSEKNPEYAKLRDDLRNAELPENKKKILEEMRKIAMKSRGITPERLRELEREAEEKIGILSERVNRSPDKYFSKILDVLYLGDERVTFGTFPSNMKFGVVSHADGNNILQLTLAGICYIAGFQQAHFKAEEANVHITDPHLKGIFQVVTGSVIVDYESSSYAGVIRARAPDVEVIEGFEKRGNLYVPSRFATSNWWRRKPDVDIAVRTGRVQLKLRSPEIRDDECDCSLP